MSYIDIFATEARGMFSPPNGNDPEIIPDLWRSASGEEVRTDLPSLSDEELNALGWKGPIQMPPFENVNSYTHNYEWNKETREYDIIEVDEGEKRRRVNYQEFWDQLINTSAYETIKATASQSLEVNTIATEFIALLSDAKNNHAYVEKIQDVITQIIENIPFSEEELERIGIIFTETGMSAVYTLS